MLQRIIIISIVVCLVVVIALMNVTTPTTIGPLGLLIVFIGAYIATVGVVSYMIYGLNRLTTWLVGLFKVGRRPAVISFRRSYYYATIIGAAPTILTGLRSVGAVGIYEYLLVGLFVVLGCVYVTKMAR